MDDIKGQNIPFPVKQWDITKYFDLKLWTRNGQIQIFHMASSMLDVQKQTVKKRILYVQKMMKDQEILCPKNFAENNLNFSLCLKLFRCVFLYHKKVSLFR